MQNTNEFILKINNDDYVVTNKSLILLKNIINDTRMIINGQEYAKLSDDLKNKFILEEIKD